jgi:hypothetical protein
MVHKSLDTCMRQHFWYKGNTDFQKWEEKIDLHLEVSYINNKQGDKLWLVNGKRN